MSQRLNSSCWTAGVLALGLGAFGALTVGAEVRLSAVFTDGMVVQRECAVPVWGWAEPGETVVVTFGEQTQKSTADPGGQWSARLEAMPATKTPKALTVSDRMSTQTVDNVVVGEVWLCSGQSNMEWPVSRISNAAAVRRAATNTLIRYLRIPRAAQLLPLDDTPCRWTVCQPDTVSGCSAVAYCFAQELFAALDVPIGLLLSSRGSSSIEPWTPPEGFFAVPELADLAREVNAWLPTTEAGRAAYQVYLTQLQQWAESCQTAIDSGQMPKSQPPLPGRIDNLMAQKTCLYNGMIHPLKPYAIRGAIWYQGESNAGQGLAYYPRMKALIYGWRQVWGQGDFPFYYVQLPAFGGSSTNHPAGGDGWAVVREAQALALDITNTGMATTIDIGEAGDIHPSNKQDVGKRLALWARARTYHQNVVYCGPLYRECSVEGNAIRILFDHVGGGLMVGRKVGLEPTQAVTDGTLQRFAIADSDKRWHWADARIDGDAVVVSSPQVPRPVAVRYAYAMNPAGANLYNQEGLPAAPFRTDKW